MTLDPSDERWIRAMVEIIEAKIRVSDSKVDALNDRIDVLIKTADDREARIRELERFNWKLVGAAGLASALGAGGIVALIP